MTHAGGSEAPVVRRGRRRRTVITLVVVAAVLGVSLFVAAGYVQGWLGKHADTPRACAPKTAVTANQVTLNVYNATSHSGLARKTADGLKKRGFKIATVANDPLEKKVTGSSEVRYGNGGARAAKLVAAQVRGAKMVQDSRSDGSLDIVIGDRFTALAPPAKPGKGTKATQPGTKASKAAKATPGKTTTTRAGSTPAGSTSPGSC